MNDLEEKGQIKKVVGHSKLSIYSRFGPIFFLPLFGGRERLMYFYSESGDGGGVVGWCCGRWGWGWLIDDFVGDMAAVLEMVD